MKDFKTIQEQINILKSRGLAITDEQTAAAFLLKNNYYRVSGYSLTLRNNNIFYPSATFQNIMDIYNFDHEFRMLLWDVIQVIEINIKSVYTYFFTQKYGPLGYLNPELFLDETMHSTIISKVMQQKQQRYSHEAFIKHHVDDLDEELPLWAAIDLFTISDISKLYTISDEDIKTEVAEYMGFKNKKASTILKTYLHCITILRNLCAHESRIFNRLFITKPSLNKREYNLLRNIDTKTKDNSHVFGYILNIKRLVEKEKFSEFKQALVELTEKYPFVEMKYYGFCDDWKEKL